MQGSKTSGGPATDDTHSAMIFQPQICQVRLLRPAQEKPGVMRKSFANGNSILPDN
jgi:hypothetical protein